MHHHRERAEVCGRQRGAVERAQYSVHVHAHAHVPLQGFFLSRGHAGIGVCESVMCLSECTCMQRVLGAGPEAEEKQLWWVLQGLAWMVRCAARRTPPACACCEHVGARAERC